MKGYPGSHNAGFMNPWPQIQPQMGLSNSQEFLEIADYSPDWDYTQGGAKVIICIKPSNLMDRLASRAQEFSVAFGFTEV